MVFATLVLADVSVGEVGAGAEPGDQPPKICIQHRNVIIGTYANPPGINPLDWRTSLYAFTGERIRYVLVVRDPNGALDIGFVKALVGGQAEVLANPYTQTITACNGFGSFDPDTDKAFEITITVEPSWYGGTEVKLTAYNSAGTATDGTHTENWFFNPAISLDVSTSDGQPIHFEDGAPGDWVHSLNKIKLKNTAEGGVNLWMFIAGTDLFDSSGAGKCPDTNYIAIEDNMWYRGWSGTQWTSWEGWAKMSRYDQNEDCGFFDAGRCREYKAPVSGYNCDRYVDWAGICEGKTPCHLTLQTAVNAAGNGEVVCVYDGTYSSPGVKITKPLTLYSLNPQGAVVTGPPYGFYISSGDVTLDGFRIESSGFGISMDESLDPLDTIDIQNVRILNCNIKNHAAAGITIANGARVRDLLVENCRFDGNLNGMEVVSGSVVEGFTVRGCSVDGSKNSGIYVEGATIGNVLVEYTKINNSLAGGIGVVNSYADGFNLVCSSLENGLFGLVADGSTTSELEIERTGVRNNMGFGMLFMEGSLSDVLVSGSVFGNNGMADISMGLLFGASGPMDVSGTDISGNDFEDGGGTVIGIYIDGSTNFGQNEIRINKNNILNGVLNLGIDSDFVNAENNWWGCPAGPNSPGCSPAFGVDYNPWLAAPYSPLSASCYGGKPVPYPNPNDSTEDVFENILTSQGTLEIEFKLEYPVPCTGTFDQGTIYIFGKAV
jgi:hypothetical protein